MFENLDPAFQSLLCGFYAREDLEGMSIDELIEMFEDDLAIHHGENPENDKKYWFILEELDSSV